MLAYLNANDLYNSYDQQKPQDEILKRLANQELLAYKITLPPTAVPEKAVEYLSATGPGYDAVPLAPVSSTTPKSVLLLLKKHHHNRWRRQNND